MSAPSVASSLTVAADLAAFFVDLGVDGAFGSLVLRGVLALVGVDGASSDEAATIFPA